MIDICTVVFEEEIPVLQVQADSIARYCTKLGVRNIYVILNDSRQHADKIDPAWWGPLRNHVQVIPRTAFSAAWVENGWVSQQLFKMLGASISYNTWTMVLDAKTIFVREFDPATFVGNDSRLAVGYYPTLEVFKPAQDIVNQFFNIDLQQVIGPAGVPFFFHNDTIRFMIAEVTYRAGKSFPLWFQEQGMLTEFMLYSGYVQYKFGSLDNFVNSTNQLGGIVNVCHSEVARFDAKFAEMKNPDTLTVSIHRNAWNQLTPEQRNQYQNFLIDTGNYTAYNLK